MKSLSPKEPLLSNKGELLTTGYSLKPILSFDAKSVNKARIKEWDFYQISSGEYTLQMTYGHVSYAGTINIVLFDYKSMRYELTLPLLFPRKSLALMGSAGDNGILKKSTKNYEIEIEVGDGFRHLTAKVNHKKYGLCSVDIMLSYPEDDDGILVSTGFENKKHFYLNYKQCCMVAEGYAYIDGKKFTFKKDSSFGLIDWGRGNLPYTHKWWWGNGSGMVNGSRFGFNIGVFGKTETHTENIFFWDGKGTKLGEIEAIPLGELYKDKYRFTSSCNKLSMEFIPLFDNYTNMNFLIAHNRCHQVFGYFSGEAVTDDKEIIRFENILAFVEFAHNRW